MSGLTSQIKERLIKEALKRRLHRADDDAGGQAAPGAVLPGVTAPEQPVRDEWCRFDQHPSYLQLRLLQAAGAQLGLRDPFFHPHYGVAGATTVIGTTEVSA